MLANSSLRWCAFATHETNKRIILYLQMRIKYKLPLGTHCKCALASKG